VLNIFYYSELNSFWRCTYNPVQFEDEYVQHCKPIANATEFMQWMRIEGHTITIWSRRPNDLAVKFATEQWLDLHQVPYDRLIFDRPDDAIYVNETPANAKFYSYDDDVAIVAALFEEWKEWKKTENLEPPVP
jgi:hypothetical protein